MQKKDISPVTAYVAHSVRIKDRRGQRKGKRREGRNKKEREGEEKERRRERKRGCPLIIIE